MYTYSVTHSNDSSLKISDIRVWVYLGCTAHEKFNPQMVSIDLEIRFATSVNAEKTDMLSDTVCYQESVNNIVDHLKTKKYNLIEKLASDTLDIIENTIKEKLGMINSIKVILTKTAPPVPHIYGGVCYVKEKYYQ